MRPAILGASIVFVLLGAASAQARTWRVNTMGTGDAPTLYAAMDSATAGDEVLVEAGEYPVHDPVRVPANVRLVGESGPANTILYSSGLFPIGTVDLSEGCTLSGIQVQGYAQILVGVNGGGVTIEQCIIDPDHTNPLHPLDSPYEVRVYFSLITGGTAYAVATYAYCILMADLPPSAAGSRLVECDVLGAVDPSIVVSEADHNFSLDPQFCGVPGSGNYFLQSTSPCLGENNPFGPVPNLVIGPLPMGCGTVRTETRTWGGVKALYR